MTIGRAKPRAGREKWIKTAIRFEVRGEQSLAKGRKVSAREQFQRTPDYYCAAPIAMFPAELGFKATAMKSRVLLKQSGTLFDAILESIEIPFA